MKNTPARFESKSGHGPIRRLHSKTLKPSPENDGIYRPFDPTDPANRQLIASIREHGIREPLIVSADRVIVSGHRRHAAAKIAGRKMLPCIVLNTRRSDSTPDKWAKLLAEHNVNQREKSFSEKLHEQLATVNGDRAYDALLQHRRERSHVNGDVSRVEMGEFRARAEISSAKIPMLKAVSAVLRDNSDFWPLSVRQIHYLLLNDAPLIHASKSGSRYQNDKKSYKALVDLLARARLEGIIPWHTIHDPTRPVSVWDVHREPSAFIRRQMEQMFTGYCRDLMQSQPNHIEIVGEKNTIEGIVKPVAMEYTIPYTIGRGFASTPPRRDMAKRFDKSGKESLILLMLSDFDPDGESIAESFARSMRDDFDVEHVRPIRVALTGDQVDEHELPPTVKAKKTSSRYAGFAGLHGDDAYELEAMRGHDLQDALRDSIDAVIDRDAYEHECEAEREDAKHIEGVRRVVRDALKGMDFDKGGDDD